jgi:hypothetical protein
VIGRIEEHLMTAKESKLSQEMSKMLEQLKKNKGVALMASKRERNQDHQPPRSWSRKIVIKIVMTTCLPNKWHSSLENSTKS